MIKMNNIHVKNLLKTCNSNKTTEWYTDAFDVLINYYFDLLEITVDSNHINLLGQVLNCIICGINLIPSEMDIKNMDYNINFDKNLGNSKLMKMARGYIDNNKPIIKEIIQYWINHRALFKQEEWRNKKNSIGNIYNLLMQCNSNKTTGWYTDAYNI